MSFDLFSCCALSHCTRCATNQQGDRATAGREEDGVFAWKIVCVCVSVDTRKPGQLPAEHSHVHTSASQSLNLDMQVHVCVCVRWAPQSLIVILFVTRRSKCVRGMRGNVRSDTHSEAMTEQKDESGWERQNDSQRYRRWEEVRSWPSLCTCARCAIPKKKKKGVSLSPLPLTRVLTECWCATIDQILLPCEHFYSLEEQRLTGQINLTSSQAFVCVWACLWCLPVFLCFPHPPQPPPVYPSLGSLWIYCPWGEPLSPVSG